MSNNKSLVDIQTVSIDQSMQVHKRMEAYIEQVKNAYCFKYNDITISISFGGDKTLEQEILDYRKNK